MRDFAQHLAAPEGPQTLTPAQATPVGPDVPIRMVTADGRHGPVAIRIYGEAAACRASSGRPGWSGCTAAASSAAGWTCPNRTTWHGCWRPAGTPVLSVDYRLARDGVSFPVPHDDALTGWFWARRNAAALGLDPDLLCLAGAAPAATSP